MRALPRYNRRVRSPSLGSALALLLALFTGCGAQAPEGAAASASTVPARRAAPAVVAPQTPVPCDGSALATRNLEAMGPAFAHPVTLNATIHGRMGSTSGTWSYDARRLVVRGDDGGIDGSDGVDDEGTWTVDATGVFLRTRPGETDGRNTFLWVLRRGHLDMLRSGALKLTCSDGPEGARAVARSSDPSLGSPALTFDRTTGALLSMDASTPLGRPQRTTFVRWGPPDGSGARQLMVWKTAWTDGADAGDAVGALEMTTTAISEKPPCPSAQKSAPACVAAPRSTYRFDVPATGIHLPFRLAMRELTLHAVVGGRNVPAFLDSGAELTSIDSGSTLGRAFVPATSMGVMTATDDSTEGGAGTLPVIALGSAQAHDVPALCVAAPVLAVFGSLRPEIFLGMSFFESSVVRIDFARQAIEMHPLGSVIHDPAAVAVPLRIVEGRFVASIEIDGTRVDTFVDTGSMGTLDVDLGWAVRTQLAAGHPYLTYASNNSAGTVTSAHALLRADRLVFGPISVDHPAIGIDDRSFSSGIAGNLGNDVLALCRAVTFDTAGRTLWIEPPCQRRLPEHHLGWRLLPTSDGHWTVEQLLPHGSAERAGILVDDEIVDVGGVHLGSDPSVLDALDRRPTGTHLRVRLLRGGKPRTMNVPLLDVFAE
jgi:predicted aspartyl protease